ncbi:MAG: helix-turn-helix domain-containing protein [Oscillospiraceae bacterium]|nr:helix-turn-helix domain-containing protein [Oscillospiraceae bacterium]
MSYFGTIYAEEELPHRAKAVYMYLRDRTNPSGTCWPGINTIAKDLAISRSTVKRALHDLTRRGFLEKELRYRDNGSSSSNMYFVKKDLS